MDELSVPFSSLCLQALQGQVVTDESTSAGDMATSAKSNLPNLLMHAVVEAARDTSSICFQILAFANPSLKSEVSLSKAGISEFESLLTHL